MDNSKMTKIDIETYLANEFAGRAWDKYSYAADIVEAIKKLLPAAEAKELTFDTIGCGRNGVSINYGASKYRLLYIEAHKKRNKTGSIVDKSGYYRGTHTYVYNTFEVNWLKDGQTLGERVTGVQKCNAQILGYNAAYKQTAVEVLKVIMESCSMSDYDVRAMCAYINENFYELRKLIEE